MTPSADAVGFPSRIPVAPPVSLDTAPAAATVIACDVKGGPGGLPTVPAIASRLEALPGAFAVAAGVEGRAFAPTPGGRATVPAPIAEALGGVDEDAPFPVPIEGALGGADEDAPLPPEVVMVSAAGADPARAREPKGPCGRGRRPSPRPAAAVGAIKTEFDDCCLDDAG